MTEKEPVKRAARARALAEAFKALEETRKKTMEEKIDFARRKGLHLFDSGLGYCIFCGKTFKQVKAKEKPLEIEYEGVKIKAYPGCKGGKREDDC
jgi:hypothetical protein